MLTMIQAVLFDLDGTLLDTAQDIVAAVNDVLVYHGQTPKNFNIIRPMIGIGTDEMVRNCFGMKPTDPYYKLIKQHILSTYQNRLYQLTDFFPGIRDTLQYLHRHQIPWGVVTNKPNWLAKPLLSRACENFPPHCLVARETLLVRKPQPEPLWYACAQLGVAHQNCVYIGDAKSDIIAAKNARMQSVAAAYGYISQHETPNQWQADHVIYSGHELKHWLIPRLMFDL
jgi:phosphoglycolate phosphatase